MGKQIIPTICYAGTDPITYTQVLDLLEKYPARGSTNIAQGMRDGLYLLGVPADGPTRPDTMPALPANCTGISCARGSSAQRVMILMTDGIGNTPPPDTACDDDPTLFEPDLPLPDGDIINRGRDCAIYYAQIAADHNITIYTVGLGNGMDVQLLEQVAEVGGGRYFAALTVANLDAIFELIR